MDVQAIVEDLRTQLEDMKRERDEWWSIAAMFADAHYVDAVGQMKTESTKMDNALAEYIRTMARMVSSE